MLLWLVFNKVSFTMKLKDNPGRVTSSGDLLQPGGVDSMILVPLRDGINTMVFTAKRPYYLEGENQGKLYIDMVCYTADQSIHDQFHTEIPISKINAKTSQPIKINPPLNCKDRETLVKFTANVPGAITSPEQYLSIAVGDNTLLFYRHRVLIKDILKEVKHSLERDDKFTVLYYFFVGLGIMLIIIFSLFETKKGNRGGK